MRTHITTAALQLHLCAAIESAQRRRPGLVTDQFLTSISDDVTLDVAELCIAGMWVRTAGGYCIRPPALRLALTALQDLAAITK